MRIQPVAVAPFQSSTFICWTATSQTARPCATTSGGSRDNGGLGEEVAVYRDTDENGILAFEVVRFRRRHSGNGVWTISATGIGRWAIAAA